jgi:hypothetical protein
MRLGSRPLPPLLRGDRVVLVEQTAEAVATPDLVRQRRLGRRRLGERRTLLERTMRTVLVVMPDVGAHDLVGVANSGVRGFKTEFTPRLGIRG